MKKVTFKFSTASTDFYFDHSFGQLKSVIGRDQAVLITDEHVYDQHSKFYKGWNTIVLKAGEDFKIQATADAIIEQLIAMEADRKTILVGVGGGVITDLTGYVASVYMRGIRFGFVPSSILAMVDASIGGKNGINSGLYKNMIGLIRQPSFILYDISLLKTLPVKEWENGFAEIIKHACINDAALFKQLQQGAISTYRNAKKNIGTLLRRNALLKTRIVQRDEFEKGERRILNFGHTLGHALENQYELMHGQAVAIGMTYACLVSEKITGFKDTNKVTRLLLQYDLPTFAAFNKQKVFDVMKMDKKRELKEMNYVLLEKIGKAVVHSIPISRLETIIRDL